MAFLNAKMRKVSGEAMIVVLFVQLSLALLPIQNCRGSSNINIIGSSNSTAYELLEAYGFPSGLLPETVTSYDLDEDDGSFSLSLESSCTVNIPGAYPVKYSASITGTLEPGSLSDLSGVNVKVFFIWWPISSITVSGSSLVFSVGPATASYDISNFSENPVCSSSSAHSQDNFS